MTDKLDVYSKVTNKIIADLERCNLIWLQPWQAGHQAGHISRPLRSGGKPYRGINILMLWTAAMEQGFNAPLWITYKQAAELGGQVRKGAKGSLVVYADSFKKTETDNQGKDVETTIPFMKGYTVFNAEQVDGLPGHFYATAEPVNKDMPRIASLERFFAATGASIRHGGHHAYYNPSQGFIQMPEFSAFRDAEDYYSTLAHEACHWTPARITA